MAEMICRTVGLTKKYKNDYALNDVNLELPKGEIYGLIGENGAGKTTLIRLIAGLAFPSSGSVELFGRNKQLEREREKIGCTIEAPALYRDMTAQQNLELQRIQKGISDQQCVYDTLEQIGLTAVKKKKVADFSLGMKQRLALGVALLGKPQFLILDEPVNGLDPTGIIELREFLKKLVREEQMTILISSHILSELHQLATRFGFLHKGRLLRQITAEQLEKECKRRICLRTDNDQKAAAVLANQLGICKLSIIPGNSIEIYEQTDQIRTISRTLFQSGLIIEELFIKEEPLETYFESLIGGKQICAVR